MASNPHDGFRYLELGDVRLQSGEVMRGARLAYQLVGRLNSARDNVIVMPTYYTGTHSNYLKIIGRGRVLDPQRFCFVIVNHFGNGVSTSPSNDPFARTGERYPRISLYDNVRQQARLVFEHLEVREVALVCGWSLGGMQAYQWAALYPERVRRLLAYCSAAKTSAYNKVFLRGLESVVAADVNWQEGRCSRPPIAGIRAFATVYAGWAYSREFFSDADYRTLGFPDQSSLLKAWEQEHLALDANDLITALRSWHDADIADNEIFAGDYVRALGSIAAHTALVAVSTDRYFAPEENQFEAALIPSCTLRVLKSPFGHCALSPGRVPSATVELEAEIAGLLRR